MRVPLVLALHGGEERALELLRDGPSVPFADDAVVHLADRRELGGRAGEERLVGVVEVGSYKVLLTDLIPKVPGQRHHGPSSDPVQAAGLDRRGRQHPVTDHEDVLPGSVGDLARLVQQDRLFVAGLQGLDLGENAVEVLPGGLRRRRERVLRVPAPARDLDADALLERLLAEVGAPRPHRDEHVHGRAQRAEAHLAVPADRGRPDVAGVQSVRADDLLGRFRQRLLRVREIHVVKLRGAAKALQVLVKVPDGRTLRRLVGTDALEDAGAVVERMAEHVDLGVAPVHELTVHPDLVDLGDRHVGSLLSGMSGGSSEGYPSGRSRGQAGSYARQRVAYSNGRRSSSGPKRSSAQGRSSATARSRSASGRSHVHDHRPRSIWTRYSPSDSSLPSWIGGSSRAVVPSSAIARSSEAKSSQPRPTGSSATPKSSPNRSLISCRGPPQVPRLARNTPPGRTTRATSAISPRQSGTRCSTHRRYAPPKDASANGIPVASPITSGNGTVPPAFWTSWDTIGAEMSSPAKFSPASCSRSARSPVPTPTSRTLPRPATSPVSSSIVRAIASSEIARVAS